MNLKFFRLFESNRDEVSYTATIFNMLVTIVTALALVTDSWMTLEAKYITIKRNSTFTYSQPYETLTFDTWPGHACNKIGTRQFWYPARFGHFMDQYGHAHITFHYNDIVMVDCITPSIANLFYVIISLSFIGMITSFSAGLLTLFAPSFGFLVWMRRNVVLELFNLLLISLALMAAIISHYEVTSMHQNAIVNVGTGMYEVTAAALLMFSSIGCSIRHHSAVRKIRRIENKRFICSRALRSWQDYNQRTEDMRPIIRDPYYDDERIIAFAHQCQLQQQQQQQSQPLQEHPHSYDNPSMISDEGIIPF
uniref:Transmembrane protein 127 transmembrane region domain-containing protein n=1 Tax=Panagrolaimus sp. PS1159 TaxID=55785 RepID=A0AC35GVC6_9BILA